MTTLAPMNHAIDFLSPLFEGREIELSNVIDTGNELVANYKVFSPKGFPVRCGLIRGWESCEGEWSFRVYRMDLETMGLS